MVAESVDKQSNEGLNNIMIKYIKKRTFPYNNYNNHNNFIIYRSSVKKDIN